MRLLPWILLALPSLWADSGEDAIRKTLAAFERAENARDGARFSALFAPDGQAGVQAEAPIQGRERIAKSLVKRLPWSETTAAAYRVRRIRVLQDAALVEADREYYGANMRRSSFCIFWLVRTAEGWQILSYRNIVPGPALSTDSPFGPK